MERGQPNQQYHTQMHWEAVGGPCAHKTVLENRQAFCKKKKKSPFVLFDLWSKQRT